MHHLQSEHHSTEGAGQRDDEDRLNADELHRQQELSGAERGTKRPGDRLERQKDGIAEMVENVDDGRPEVSADARRPTLFFGLVHRPSFNTISSPRRPTPLSVARLS